MKMPKIIGLVKKIARTNSAVPSVTSSKVGVETEDNRNQVSRKFVISYHRLALICHTYPPPIGKSHNHSFCPKDIRYIGVQNQRLAKQRADDSLRELRDLSLAAGAVPQRWDAAPGFSGLPQVQPGKCQFPSDPLLH